MTAHKAGGPRARTLSAKSSETLDNLTMVIKPIRLNSKEEKEKDIVGSSLPRSIRWRLQLGVFKIPSHPKKLFKENKKTLKKQRDNYDRLTRLYRPTYASSKMELEENREELHHLAEQDPLTLAMAERSFREIHEMGRNFSLKSKMFRRADQLMLESNLPKCDALERIQKDLEKLSLEQYLAFHKLECNERTEANAPAVDIDDCVPLRNHLLEELLHTYAMEQSYKSGMHLVASHLLFCVEMDLAYTKQCWKRFLERKYLLHDTYAAFCKLVNNIPSSEPDIETMLSIVSKEQPIQQLLRNQKLQVFDEWQSSLFCGQVDGWRNVFQLWDILFDLVTQDSKLTSMDNSRYTRPGAPSPIRLGEFDLRDILPLTTASLIWLHRKGLTEKTACYAYFVNVKPLESVTGLMATLLASARRFQLLRDDNKLSDTSSSTENDEPIQKQPEVVPVKKLKEEYAIQYRLGFHRQSSQKKMADIGRDAGDLLVDDVHSSDDEGFYDDEEQPLNDNESNDEVTNKILEVRSRRGGLGGRRRSSLLLKNMLRGSSRSELDDSNNTSFQNSLVLDFSNESNEPTRRIVNGFHKLKRRLSKDFDNDEGGGDTSSPDKEQRSRRNVLRRSSHEGAKLLKEGIQTLRRRLSKDFETEETDEEVELNDSDEFLRDDYRVTSSSTGGGGGGKVLQRSASLVNFVTMRRYSFDDGDALSVDSDSESEQELTEFKSFHESSSTSIMLSEANGQVF